MAQALPVATDCCTPCTPCAVTVFGGGNDADSLACPLPAKSLAEGRNYTSEEAAACGTLRINGNETGGDGFIGWFSWDALSTAEDDAAYVLEAADNPSVGRWIRVT